MKAISSHIECVAFLYVHKQHVRITAGASAFIHSGGPYSSA